MPYTANILLTPLNILQESLLCCVNIFFIQMCNYIFDTDLSKHGNTFIGSDIEK